GAEENQREPSGRSRILCRVNCLTFWTDERGCAALGDYAKQKKPKQRERENANECNRSCERRIPEQDEKSDVGSCRKRRSEKLHDIAHRLPIQPSERLHRCELLLLRSQRCDER